MKGEIKMEEIRSIKNYKRPVGFYLRANWIFSSNLEKIILLVFIGLAWWKIIEILRFMF
jgi:hypothetical protein